MSVVHPASPPHRHYGPISPNPPSALASHAFRRSLTDNRWRADRQHRGLPYPVDITFHYTPIMNVPGVDEMEQFQRLSDHYQPDLPGPLVGDKQSIGELVHEFAKADPQFVAKTSSLTRSHSAYRKVKGDGQCGWRGATCGYFEIVLGAGDIGLVAQEEIRIRSFEETMKMVGIDYELMEDMFEPTWELFAAIRKAVESKQKHNSILSDYFNDELKSNSIVYHFKMMTSSYMQLRPDAYEPFLEMSIQEYRVSRIDPTNQEIDQIGLQALTDGVIAPAGIAVEVLYLDRSIGDEVTPYQFVPNAHGWPTIRLLYRPGHYDLIYKDDQPLKVFLQPNEVRVDGISDVEMHSTDPYLFSYLLPNATLQSGSSQLPVSRQSTGHSQHSYQGPYYPADNFYDVPSFSQQPVYQIQQQPPPPPPPVAVQPVPTIHPHPPSEPHQHLSSPATTTGPSSANAAASGEFQIRYNPNTFEFALHHHNMIPLDQPTFGTEALSQAHFRNSKFQPHVWNARDEYSRP